MSRSYREPVAVRRGDSAPDQFLWRGRLYLVRDVLGHWLEACPWWQPAVRPPGGEAGTGESTPAVVAGELAGQEREYWRVEAASGRAFPGGIYDLCFDWISGEWTVAGAHD